MSESPPPTRRVALLIFASERKFYLNLLVISLWLRRPSSIDYVLMCDTSETDQRWLSRSLLQRLGAPVEVIRKPGVLSGRSLPETWRYLADNVGATHVVMFEEDFILLRKLDVERLVELADSDATLQVVLPRQRWFRAEYQYASRRAYLLANNRHVVSPEGDRLERYFTANPHVMRLDRILSLTNTIPPSDDYSLESEYSDAASLHDVNSLQIRSRTPWVWHLGAATSLGVRASIKSGTPTIWVYAKAHAKRALVATWRMLGSVRWLVTR